MTDNAKSPDDRARSMIALVRVGAIEPASLQDLVADTRVSPDYRIAAYDAMWPAYPNGGPAQHLAWCNASLAAVNATDDPRIRARGMLELAERNLASMSAEKCLTFLLDAATNGDGPTRARAEMHIVDYDPDNAATRCRIVLDTPDAFPQTQAHAHLLLAKLTEDADERRTHCVRCIALTQNLAMRDLAQSMLDSG